MKLISKTNKQNIVEQRARCEKLINGYISRINEGKSINLSEHAMMLHEARNLERCIIAEAVSDSTFMEAQKTFRSMMQASNIISKWLKGTDLAYMFETMRKEGIEMLNDLYEDIKNLEGGVNLKKAGIKLPKEVAERRNNFLKLFTKFAVLFRGTMSIADLFTDEPSSVGGYSEMKGIINQLEMSGNSDKPLVQVFKQGKQLTGMRGLFGGNKVVSVEPKFRAAIKAAASVSPGFMKMIDVDNLATYLMTKSMDQLQALFGRFNDLAMNVDESFIKKITMSSIGSMFAKMFSAAQGGAGVRTLG
jgi:hypothetical protein